MTVVAYINHQGGTHSITLMDIAFNLFGVILDLGVTLQVCYMHILCRFDHKADLLSHSHHTVNTEWMLKCEVAHAL